MSEWYEKINEIVLCELTLWFWWLENIIPVLRKYPWVNILCCACFWYRINPFFVLVIIRWHEESCGHVEYPCRFQSPAARLQRVIPYRVFAPWCLMKCCEEHLLQLIPQCLSAAYTTLGTHPFSRLDVLIVPSNFSSLGMAR